jgi:hypothetical protein
MRYLSMEAESNIKKGEVAMKKIAVGLLAVAVLSGVAFAGLESNREESGKGFGLAQDKGGTASVKMSGGFASAKSSGYTASSANTSKSLKADVKNVSFGSHATKGDRTLIPAVGNGGLVLGGVIAVAGIAGAVATAPAWATALMVTGVAVAAVGAYFKIGSYLMK